MSIALIFLAWVALAAIFLVGWARLRRVDRGATQRESVQRPDEHSLSQAA